jgi:hypothetical protein
LDQEKEKKGEEIMPKEFLMRGKTNSGIVEKLEFGGQARPGYGYKLVNFQLYPTQNLGVGTNHELCGTITAATTAETPHEPNFNHDGLIATSFFTSASVIQAASTTSVINDLFVITQDLLLMVQDQGGDSNPINWQCRFEEVKLSTAGEAVANFKQYTIYNTSS